MIKALNRIMIGGILYAVRSVNWCVSFNNWLNDCFKRLDKMQYLEMVDVWYWTHPTKLLAIRACLTGMFSWGVVTLCGFYVNFYMLGFQCTLLKGIGHVSLVNCWSIHHKRMIWKLLLLILIKTLLFCIFFLLKSEICILHCCIIMVKISRGYM